MSHRIAFLIGNQVFRLDSGLTPLRGPHNDVAALAEILGDPKRGQFAVHQFLDRPHYEILPEIEQALGDAKSGDLVLIYYSGHGKLDRGGRVCLATADTREGSLQATSIPARNLQELVNQSDCDQVVLLLDCCYSGALDVLRGSDVASEMRIIEDAKGFYILTASTGMQAAREESLLLGGPVMGRFTSALVEGIDKGVSDIERKGRILLSDLRRHLEKTVSGQTPQFFARRAVGDPLISLSPLTATPMLDPSIVADLEAGSWHHRVGAVSYLISMMREGSTGAQQAARRMLEGHLLIERDIEVRRRVEEGLAPPSITLQPAGEPARPALRRPTPKRITAMSSGIVIAGLAGFVWWHMAGPKPSEIDGNWSGRSNQSDAKMQLSSKGVTGRCSAIDGVMLSASDKTSVEGYFCPAERSVSFVRKLSGVACQQYDGLLARGGAGVAATIQGGFTVTNDCGGAKRDQPYPFRFTKSE